MIRVNQWLKIVSIYFDLGILFSINFDLWLNYT